MTVVTPALGLAHQKTGQSRYYCRVGKICLVLTHDFAAALHTFGAAQRPFVPAAVVLHLVAVDTVSDVALVAGDVEADLAVSVSAAPFAAAADAQSIHYQHAALKTAHKTLSDWLMRWKLSADWAFAWGWRSERQHAVELVWVFVAVCCLVQIHTGRSEIT